MTLYYIDTPEPHWVPADEGEQVYQALGVRVTYTEVLPDEEAQETTWQRSFDFYLDTEPSDVLKALYLIQPEVVEQLFPESPPVVDTPATPVSIYTPDPSRMDISKTSVTIDSSSVTIDQITV